MMYDTNDAIALLGRTPAVFRFLLLDLPEQWLEAPEGPGAWSAREVVCHVADLERDGWLPRLEFLLKHGAGASLPGIERERFRATYSDVPLQHVLDDFERLRRDNLERLARMPLSRRHLNATGRHPAFGDVRASELLSTWVVHDLTHQAQIARALAAQYREAVGPWRDYLSVLRPHP